MAFADPQSVTVSGTAISLPRVSQGIDSGGFKSSDGNTALTVGHKNGPRNRRTIRLQSTKVGADPLLSGANNYYSMSTYLVVDTPKVGFTVAEAKAVVDALVAYLSASTGANVTKLLGDEI
jgi:hypothetical protein